jgi:hypothetical protein
MSALNSNSSTVSSGPNASATLGMSAGSTMAAPSRLSSPMAASAIASPSGVTPNTPSRQTPMRAPRSPSGSRNRR